MTLYRLLSVVLCTVFLNQCSPNSNKPDEEIGNIALAKGIATQLDTMSTALATIEDYDTMRVAEKKIEAAANQLVSLYASVKDRKTSTIEAEEMKAIIQPAGARLTEAKSETLAKFKDNPAVTYGVVIMFNRISKSYKEVSGKEFATQVAPAPTPASTPAESK